MIDQLLDVTRIRLGHGMRPRRSRFDLVAVCLDVVEELTVGGVGERIRLRLPAKLEGEWDKGCLAQVASNLVSNALHHGKENSPITVELALEQDSLVRLRVHNEGYIPASTLPTIFEPFRTSQAPSRRGLGLGLFIVREIVSAHGGTIEVQSTPSAGTTFTVKLPRSGS
jgi:signal transduction histidine kinase